VIFVVLPLPLLKGGTQCRAVVWLAEPQHGLPLISGSFDSPSTVFCRRWTGDSICIISIFILLIYSYLLFTTSDSLFLYLVLCENCNLTLCGRIWYCVGVILYDQRIAAHLHRSYQS
jgi:hypothetical protein